ncbi:agamous-like MADS-box protein MADS2 isoform X3 [Punica granatum]|uniref:Agamous-like MADS-box protein MADS2 isoform X3 n=1 Tax=Punica granatum TaxID=22663 RepID=A0A6P8E5P6_PUNGR|nr:agamous-like MADS-box protein MADS2 isoform X3 [Punica granatum]XP_031405272.1 agamous-like MADS-box protein MADS2 isoform X3 [Punica granatum]
MACSRRLMSSLSSVMLRLPSSSSPPAASSTSSPAPLACRRPLSDTKGVVTMLSWRAADRSLRHSYQEYLKLKARVEDLQQTQRNLLGEDLGSLSMKELEQLERQLESSLKHIRSTKDQSMNDQFTDLQKREQMLLEANESLRRKLEESCAHFPFQLSWEAAGAQLNLPYGRIPAPQAEANFFHPLDCNSTLQIGYNQMGSTDDQVNAASTSQTVTGYIPGWMFN